MIKPGSHTFQEPHPKENKTKQNKTPKCGIRVETGGECVFVPLELTGVTALHKEHMCACYVTMACVVPFHKDTDFSSKAQTAADNVLTLCKVEARTVSD